VNKDIKLLAEAYEQICEDINPVIVMLPLIVAVAVSIGLGTISSQWIGPYDPRTFKEKIQDWFKERKLISIAKRLKNDPEVVEFVKNPRMKGWQEMIKTKLSPEEIEYVKRLNRSHFTWKQG
jgi:ABC-type long-subunit fatty acid transport system fused permease/ATPase subunit